MCKKLENAIIISSPTWPYGKADVQGFSFGYNGSYIKIEYIKDNIYILTIISREKNGDGSGDVYTDRYTKFSFKREMAIEDIASQLLAYAKSRNSFTIHECIEKLDVLKTPQTPVFDDFMMEESVIIYWLLTLDTFFNPKIKKTLSKGKRVHSQKFEDYSLNIFENMSFFESKNGLNCRMIPTPIGTVFVELGYGKKDAFKAEMTTGEISFTELFIFLAVRLKFLAKLDTADYINKTVERFNHKNNAEDIFAKYIQNENFAYNLLDAVSSKWLDICSGKLKEMQYSEMEVA